MALWPQSSPNSFPRVVQIFSWPKHQRANVNIVECCNKQGYMHSLLGHNAGISESCWGFCHMSPSYKPGLTTKIFHLDINDHVTFHVLMIWWWHNTISKNVKGNTHNFHLQFNCVMPKRSTSCFIDRVSLFNSFG